MSDDRTTPMQQPPGGREDSASPAWSRRETNLDEQETIYADQERVTPPTLPFDERQRWQTSTDPSAIPTDPTVGPRPPSFPPSQAPPGAIHPPRPPIPQAPQGPEAQTMIISERPTPTFAWLVVLDGPDRNTIGQIHTLHPDTTTVGRLAGNQVTLHDETVSGQHARIRREAKEGQDPTYALFDLGSRNGTFVGDRQSYRDEESRVYRRELKDGDYLLIGETTLVFKKV